MATEYIDILSKWKALAQLLIREAEDLAKKDPGLISAILLLTAELVRTQKPR